MCRPKEKKVSSEELALRKAARREKRSGFLSRLVDEFKKIMVLYSTVFVTGFLIWEHSIYANGVTPTLPYAIPVALISGYFTVIVAYCFAAYKEKDSLNKAGLTKTSAGISKIVGTVIDAVSGAVSKDNKSDDSGAAG